MAICGPEPMVVSFLIELLAKIKAIALGHAFSLMWDEKGLTGKYRSNWRQKDLSDQEKCNSMKCDTLLTAGRSFAVRTLED